MGKINEEKYERIGESVREDRWNDIGEWIKIKWWDKESTKNAEV